MCLDMHGNASLSLCLQDMVLVHVCSTKSLGFIDVIWTEDEVQYHRRMSKEQNDEH
jgi:hypothetical protein